MGSTTDLGKTVSKSRLLDLKGTKDWWRHLANVDMPGATDVYFAWHDVRVDIFDGDLLVSFICHGKIKCSFAVNIVTERKELSCVVMSPVAAAWQEEVVVVKDEDGRSLMPALTGSANGSLSGTVAATERKIPCVPSMLSWCCRGLPWFFWCDNGVECWC